jgi:hypothetical protein
LEQVVLEAGQTPAVTDLIPYSTLLHLRAAVAVVELDRTAVQVAVLGIITCRVDLVTRLLFSRLKETMVALTLVLDTVLVAGVVEHLLLASLLAQ